MKWWKNYWKFKKGDNFTNLYKKYGEIAENLKQNYGQYSREKKILEKLPKL